MLGACNTCVKLHSRVKRSGATVNSWMILFYFSLLLLWLLLLLLLLLFCLFLFFFSHFFVWFVVLGIVGLFADVCSSSLHCCCHCFGLFLFSFIKGSPVFIWMGAGTGWSYNLLLVSKLTFLILKLYINFLVWQGSLAVIRELFIILYISNIFY